MSPEPGLEPCVFCEIVAGRAPASIVYEDDLCLAIMTIGPVNPGHLLVLPRAHAPSLADLDEATGGHLFAVAMRMAAAIRASGLRCEGINLFLADGEAAFQEGFTSTCTSSHALPETASASPLTGPFTHRARSWTRRQP